MISSKNKKYKNDYLVSYRYIIFFKCVQGAFHPCECRYSSTKTKRKKSPFGPGLESRGATQASYLCLSRTDWSLQSPGILDCVWRCSILHYPLRLWIPCPSTKTTSFELIKDINVPFRGDGLALSIFILRKWTNNPLTATFSEWRGIWRTLSGFSRLTTPKKSQCVRWLYP